MYAGSVHLHNVLRWVILILLLLNVYRHATASAQPYGEKDRKLGLFLMIGSHIMLLLGLFQYFAGDLGLKLITNAGMGETMKNAATRYWAVEHGIGMILAIVLVTLGYGVRKKTVQRFCSNTVVPSFYYTIALLIILASMPWPWREGVGRPWLPGM
jgi:hypothetical protein